VKKRALYISPSLSVCLLNAFAFRERELNGVVRLRPSSLHALYYIVQGGGTLRMQDETVRIAPRLLIHIPPGRMAEVSGCGETVRYYVAVFSYAVGRASSGDGAIRMNRETLSLLPAGALPFVQDETIEALFKRLDDGCRQMDDFRLQLVFQELMHGIVQRTKTPGDAHSSERNVERTIEYMKLHYHEKLDVKRLSEMAGMTLSSYSRLFKQVEGVAPTEYLTRLRMDNAKKMLTQQRRKIKEVASAVGYRDEFYFSHVFHRSVGVSPKTYMKQSRMKVAFASCLHFPDCLRSLGLEPAASVNCFRYPGMGEEEFQHVYRSRMEELRAAKPDLIVCDRHHLRFEAEFKTLADQVISLTEMNWRSNYDKIAEIIGLQAEMDERLRQLERRVAEARRRLQNGRSGETFAVIQVTHLGIRIQGMVGHPLNELLYGELGLAPGKNIPMTTAGLELAPEWLPPIEADRLLVHMNHLRAGSEDVYDRLRSTHAWSAIRAVRQGRVHLIPNWFRMSWSPGGRETIMGELLDLLQCSERVPQMS